MNKIRTSYNHTIYASYIGYITQAIVNNFVPLLFLTFVSDYNLTLDKITLITTLNFLVQLCVDLLSARYVDKIGYRTAVVAAHVFSALGLISLAFLPDLLGNAYIGILISVVFYAIGGGIIEVLVSPIVEACPTEKKEAAMSLLHSFYCWGHLAVVLLSTAFFHFVGIENWKILACLWAIIPIFNIFYFSQVPIYSLTEGHEKMSFGALVKEKVFWLLILMMLCAAASEQAMSQWASAFAEAGLNVSKAVGDLAGPSAFALCMGTSRALYGKYADRLPLDKAIIGSCILCAVCYLTAVFAGSPLLALIGCAVCGFSVGILWPGSFSMAAIKFPGGGTAMYAIMALAGDLGCSLGPTLVGLRANANGDNLKMGLSVGVLFPLIMLLGILVLNRTPVKNQQS